MSLTGWQNEVDIKLCRFLLKDREDFTFQQWKDFLKDNPHDISASRLAAMIRQLHLNGVPSTFADVEELEFGDEWGEEI